MAIIYSSISQIHKLQFAQYETTKFLLIKPANPLLGENFSLWADMQADICIRTSISANMPSNTQATSLISK